MPPCPHLWFMVLAALGGMLLGIIGLFAVACWDVRREDARLLASFDRRR